jgi:hypothetical protein
MAIDRGPWNALIDDDGSNLIGTVWNKDKIKTVILDPTDAAIAAVPASTPTYGAWTPVDLSGAGLVFAYKEGTYARFDRLVFVAMQIVYPSTGSGLQAKIGGLPAVVATPSAGGVSGYGIVRGWYLPKTLTEIQPYEIATGTLNTNAQMSGLNVIMTSVYLTV